TLQRKGTLRQLLSAVTAPGRDLRRAVRRLEPGDLTDADRDVRHRPLVAGAVPVLLAGRRRDAVAHAEPALGLAPALDPALTLDDVEELAPGVPVPVVASAGLESDQADADGVRFGGAMQRPCAGGTGEVAGVGGLTLVGLFARGHVHPQSVSSGHVRARAAAPRRAMLLLRQAAGPGAEAGGRSRRVHLRPLHQALQRGPRRGCALRREQGRLEGDRDPWPVQHLEAAPAG